ncbi:MAG: hypothetical protein KJ630_16155, partial [Proteobacteria bacterium]|nr:hypothetical protein [Pseudomonadota bacterium]
SKNPKCSIKVPFLGNNFEFTKEPNHSFSGVILGHNPGQNDQELSILREYPPEITLADLISRDLDLLSEK